MSSADLPGDEQTNPQAIVTKTESNVDGGKDSLNKKDEEEIPTSAELLKILTDGPLNTMTPTDVLAWLCSPERGSWKQRQWSAAARLIYEADREYYNQLFRSMGFAVTPPAKNSNTGMYILWRVPAVPDEMVEAMATNQKTIQEKTEAWAKAHQPGAPEFRQTMAGYRAQADERKRGGRGGRGRG